jgi:LysM repeat protein
LTNKRFLVYLKKNILYLQLSAQGTNQEAGMTVRPSVFIQAACISLLIMFVPSTATTQEQREPVGQQSEQAVKKSAEPQSEPTDTMSGRGQTTGQVLLAPSDKKPQTVTSAGERASSANEENTEYTIKKGDTLWDISNAFYKDPFLWPFIWKANPSITNPDLIYAGNKLTIPSLAPLERAMQKPTPTPLPEEEVESARAVQPRQVQPAEKETGGNILILPEEQPEPIIDKYAMLSAGFVNGMKNTDIIVDSAGEPNTIFAYGDSVYVKFGSPENVKIGDKYLIYTSLGDVKHPRTGKRYGQLIRGLGVLEVTAKDPSVEVATARITLSFDTIEKNNWLIPYQEPMLVFPSSVKKSKDISGYILAVTNKRSIVGQMDFVYIDKGSVDGVDPGDSFIVYADPRKSGEPRKKIGEVQVFLVKERSSTAIVRRSSDVLTTGNFVDFKK